MSFSALSIVQICGRGQTDRQVGSACSYGSCRVHPGHLNKHAARGPGLDWSNKLGAQICETKRYVPPRKRMEIITKRNVACFSSYWTLCEDGRSERPDGAGFGAVWETKAYDSSWLLLRLALLWECFVPKTSKRTRTEEHIHIKPRQDYYLIRMVESSRERNL